LESRAGMTRLSGDLQMTKNLLCYAAGRAGDWEAICVDLDLAVQGQSFDEARALLQRSIDLYVAEAAKEAPEEAARLLSRAAPLWVRTKWAAKLFWHLVSRQNGRDRSYAGFDLSCPA
jgi:predicted RNase H-like HicB family nuclease